MQGTRPSAVARGCGGSSFRQHVQVERSGLEPHRADLAIADSVGTSDLDARISDNGSLPTPEVLLFDVYETLSDTSPLGGRLVELGAPAHLARTWLTTLRLPARLRVEAARAPARFTPLAIGTLSTSLAGLPLNRTVDEAVAHIMGGFDELDLHSDVPEDLSTLVALGPRLAVGACSPADSSSP